MAVYAQSIYPLPFYGFLRVLHPELKGSLWQRVAESFIQIMPEEGLIEGLWCLNTLSHPFVEVGETRQGQLVEHPEQVELYKIIKYKEAETNEEGLTNKHKKQHNTETY